MTLRGTFCGDLSQRPERLRDWRDGLARAFEPIPWAGEGREGSPLTRGWLVSAGRPVQVYNDAHAFAFLVGEPYRLPGADQPATLADIVANVTEQGPAALTRIGGAFALAVVFPARDEALLAIDRFAIENLFFVPTDDGVAFATRSQPLAAHPTVAHRFSSQAIYDYLYFHCIPGPDTGYLGMSRLLPGQYLHRTGGRNVLGTYWQPEYREETTTPRAALAAELPRVIDAAVHRRLSPGPVACFLSGGLDSSTVTGLCAKHAPGNVTAFTIGFDAPGYDEMEFANTVVRHFDVKHVQYYVKPQDIVDSLPTILGAMDGPFGNASVVPTYFCAKVARENGFLSMMAGDGGDELFGGNSRYATQILFERYARVPGALRHTVMEPIAAHLPEWARRGVIGKAASYVRQAAAPLPDRLMTYNLLNWIRPETFLTPEFLAEVDTAAPLARLREMYQLDTEASMINRLLHLDWRLTLADSDLPKVCRATTLAGLDVHYPMLDEAVFDFAARLPTGTKVTSRVLRPLYREAFKGFLPQATLTKSKQGFGLPFGVWLRENDALKAFASDQLHRLEDRGILQRGFHARFLSAEVQAYPAYFGVLVWVLVAMSVWQGPGADLQLTRRSAARAA
ncbi:MAG: asparagine synthetase B [Gammaproteobacteria bacterium]